MKRISILLGIVFCALIAMQGEISAQRLHDQLRIEHQKEHQQEHQKEQDNVQNDPITVTIKEINVKQEENHEAVFEQKQQPDELKYTAVVNEDNHITSTGKVFNKIIDRVQHPMTYAEATLYQGKYSEDIRSHLYTEKDSDGNKKKLRIFDFLKNEGLYHSGNTLVGLADRTALRLTVNYGFEGSYPKAIASIGWSADLAGNPNNGYKPNYMRFVFESGYIKEIPLQGWQYQQQLITGVFTSSWGHCFWGSINLSDVDVYEILQHGNISAVYVDDGNNQARHFFYSGDKDTKNKAIFARGFQHIAKILDINTDTIKQELSDQQINAEKERKDKLRSEIQKEINDEKEREAMKKEILDEMGKNQDKGSKS